MKTLIDTLVGQFIAIAHPSGGWFKIKAAEKGRPEKVLPALILSPDCFAVRGGASKNTSARLTPAP